MAIIARSTAFSVIMPSLFIDWTCPFSVTAGTVYSDTKSFCRIALVSEYTVPDGKNPAAMQAEQDLHQPVSDQLMQSEQFAIGAGQRFGVVGVGRGSAAGLERVSGLFDNR